MINWQRGLLMEHLSEKELDQAIEAAQKTTDTRLVRRLCFINVLRMFGFVSSRFESFIN